jgi:acyl-CoA thioesterase I
MIIVRQIILAFTLLALTSCTGSPGADGDGTYGSGRDDAAGTPSGQPGRGSDAGAAAGQAGQAGRGADAGQTGAGQLGPGAMDGGGADAAAPGGTSAGRVVFVGTSLTAGYGVGEELAWPAVIQRKIAAAGLPFQVVNAGISGETSAGGLRRIDWTLQQPVDVLVVELGANDGLRGLDPDAMRANIDEILRRARQQHPDVALVLVGMEAPPNLGEAYTTRFRNVFRDLARRHDAALVPFLLDGVAAQPALNLQDGIHPNPEGHRIIAETAWRVIGPVLRQQAAHAGAAGSR